MGQSKAPSECLGPLRNLRFWILNVENPQRLSLGVTEQRVPVAAGSIKISDDRYKLVSLGVLASVDESLVCHSAPSGEFK